MDKKIQYFFKKIQYYKEEILTKFNAIPIKIIIYIFKYIS